MTACPFCKITLGDQIIARHETVFAILDKYPVTEGHTLIVPFRHSENYFSMSQKERTEADQLLFQVRDQIMRSDLSITGFNIGVNCGLSAGQTIMHSHIHLIPRRHGDTFNPTGGVRGVIPEKIQY